jgi:hypothetical protein
MEGRVYRARSEGHACHARPSGMGSPTQRSGPDKRVPPSARDKRVPRESEGHACHARGSVMDNPTLCSGRDKRVPLRWSLPCKGDSWIHPARSHPDRKLACKQDADTVKPEGTFIFATLDGAFRVAFSQRRTGELLPGVLMP